MKRKKRPRKHKDQKTYPKTPHANSPIFLQSFAWRRLRMEVLEHRGTRCECCGATPDDGVRIHVDHIKPRRFFPKLALKKTNLQILCED